MYFHNNEKSIKYSFDNLAPLSNGNLFSAENEPIIYKNNF